MKYLKLSLIAVAVVGLNGCFLEGDNGQTGMTGKIAWLSNPTLLLAMQTVQIVDFNLTQVSTLMLAEA